MSGSLHSDTLVIGPRSDHRNQPDVHGHPDNLLATGSRQNTPLWTVGGQPNDLRSSRTESGGYSGTAR